MPPQLLILMYIVIASIIVVQNPAIIKWAIQSALPHKQEPSVKQIQEVVENRFLTYVKSFKIEDEIQKVMDLRNINEDNITLKIVEYTPYDTMINNRYYYMILAVSMIAIAMIISCLVCCRCRTKKLSGRQAETKRASDSTYKNGLSSSFKTDIRGDKIPILFTGASSNSYGSTRDINMDSNYDLITHKSVELDPDELDFISKFMNCKQGDESVEEYSTRLTQLAEKAFKNTLQSTNNVLIQQFLKGLKDEVLEQKLYG